MSLQSSFKPDYAIPPGEILLEILEARGISQAEMARRCGRPEKTISSIINGSTGIIAPTALQFEKVLGINAQTWLNLESTYKIWQERKEEGKKLSCLTDWVKCFPIAEMKKRGIILPSLKDSGEIAGELLRFFGVSSIPAFEEHVMNPIACSLRHSPAFKSDNYALYTWLREGEIRAKEISIKNFDKQKFISAIYTIREMTRESIETSLPKAIELCREAGVSLIPVKPYKGVAVSGVARWIKQNQSAMIQLSLRGKTSDILWFSFFHECAHILKHPKRKIYIDDGKTGVEAKEELEADNYAQEILIPHARWGEFIGRGSFSSISICSFSEEINIAPGIVLGRLQKEGFVKYHHHNNLKERFDWADH